MNRILIIAVCINFYVHGQNTTQKSYGTVTIDSIVYPVYKSQRGRSFIYLQKDNGWRVFYLYRREPKDTLKKYSH